MAYTKVKTGRELACKNCGKLTYVPPYRFTTFKFCSPSCAAQDKPFVKGQAGFKRNYGADHPRYKGGSMSEHGYWKICVNGKQVYQHRYVMEQHIGRTLERREQIHHLDGNKLNNDIKNLLLLPSAKAHREYHRDNDTRFPRPCRVCGKTFDAKIQTAHVCDKCRTYTCKTCGVTNIQEPFVRVRSYCSSKCRYAVGNPDTG